MKESEITSSDEYFNQITKALAWVRIETESDVLPYGGMDWNPSEWAAILSEHLGRIAANASRYHYWGKWDGLYEYRRNLIFLAADTIRAIRSIEQNELKACKDCTHLKLYPDSSFLCMNPEVKRVTDCGDFPPLTR